MTSVHEQGELRTPISGPQLPASDVQDHEKAGRTREDPLARA